MIKHNIIYTASSNWRFDIKSAEGSYITLSDGQTVIDFTSGYNIANLGWNNKELLEAADVQLKKNTAVTMWSTDQAQWEYAEAFMQVLPKSLRAVGRAIGGMESIEEAVKTARAYTGKKNIIGFQEMYHGQSLTAIALTYPEAYMLPKAVQPSKDGFIRMEYPKKGIADEGAHYQLFLEKLENLLKAGDVAGVLTEPGMITGWGSTDILPDMFSKDIRMLTEKYKTLLIFDEVGTGFSRTGTLFGMNRIDVIPDIAVFAKGMSNGVLPIGAMVTTTEIADATWNKTQLQSSFGWNPVSCAVAHKVLEIHTRDMVWEKAKIRGAGLLDSLKKSLSGVQQISTIDGIGMEIGIQFTATPKMGETLYAIRDLAMKNGAHIICNGATTIQIMPPLTTDEKILDEGAEILVAAIKEECGKL